MVFSRSFHLFPAPGGWGSFWDRYFTWFGVLKLCLARDVHFCLQAVWDNSCLGTGLCKGYFGLSHRTCLPCAGGSGISEGTHCLPELVFLAMGWTPDALHAVKQELWKFSFGNQTEVTSGAICEFGLSCCPACSTVREGDSKLGLVIVRLSNGVWKPLLKEMFRSLKIHKTNWADKPLLTKDIVRVWL